MGSTASNRQTTNVRRKCCLHSWLKLTVVVRVLRQNVAAYFDKDRAGNYTRQTADETCQRAFDMLDSFSG